MDEQELQQVANDAATSLPGVILEHRVNPNWETYKVGGKVFLLMTDMPGHAVVTVKADPEEPSRSVSSLRRSGLDIGAPRGYVERCRTGTMTGFSTGPLHQTASVRVLNSATCTRAIPTQDLSSKQIVEEGNSRRGWAAVALGAFVIVMTETQPVGPLPPDRRWTRHRTRPRRTDRAGAGIRRRGHRAAVLPRIQYLQPAHAHPATPPVKPALIFRSANATSLSSHTRHTRSRQELSPTPFDIPPRYLKLRVSKEAKDDRYLREGARGPCR